MPRPPSLSPDEAERLLGPRGALACTTDNRATLRKWACARGLPAAFCAGLSMRELELAYNDATENQFAKLQKKLAESAELVAEAGLMSPTEVAMVLGNGSQAGTPGAVTPAADTAIAEALALAGSVSPVPATPISRGNGHTPAPASASPAEPSDAASQLVAAVRALASSTAAPVDESTVRALINDELARFTKTLAGDYVRWSTELETRLKAVAPAATMVTVLHKPAGEQVALPGAQHANMPDLIRLAQARGPDGYVPGIFLQGEASSGKSTATRLLAQALQLSWYFNGAISMPHEMLGFVDGHGQYHTTPFREAYEHGGVYCFDECDRSDPGALLAVNPHLASGVATFPDRQVKRHPDCIIIATANTWGLGADAAYSGATKLDAAFLDRFPLRLNWDIDSRLEQALAAAASPRHGPAWCNRVQAARTRAHKAGLKVMITTRATIAGAALIEQGFTPDQAAAMTYLANLKPAQRKQVEG